MRAADATIGAIDRAAETDADSGGISLPENLAHGSLNLFADALATEARSDVEAPAAINDAGSVAGNYLQLRAANFNAQEHKLEDGSPGNVGQASCLSPFSPKRDQNGETGKMPVLHFPP